MYFILFLGLGYVAWKGFVKPILQVAIVIFAVIMLYFNVYLKHFPETNQMENSYGFARD